MDQASPGCLTALFEVHMRESFDSLRKCLGCTIATALFVGATLLLAQQSPPKVPYASIASSGVTYAGPGREAAFNLAGPTIRIGLLAPMHGPQQADGEAIVQAAKMALADAQREPLPGGLHLSLDIADESVPPWGILDDEIIHLVIQQKVVAIVTGADGVAAHLSEQIGNKIGVPTLTLSSDPTTTQINLPWIFRLGPSDTQQARLIARDIYRTRGFQHVVLVTERDHDGRIGEQEFVQAARELGAPAPASVMINPLQPDAGSLLKLIKKQPPQAFVFWTEADIGRKLLEALHSVGIHAPIYLSQETAQKGSGLEFHRLNTAGIKDASGVGIYTVASALDATPSRESFARRFQAATGARPSPVAFEAYDAVWLVAQAVRDAGPNRARVRDHVSATRNFAGVSGTISFDSQGDNRAEACLVHLQ